MTPSLSRSLYSPSPSSLTRKLSPVTSSPWVSTIWMRRSFSTEVTIMDSLEALSLAASRMGFDSGSKKVSSFRNADRSSPICPLTTPPFPGPCCPASSSELSAGGRAVPFGAWPP